MSERVLQLSDNIVRRFYGQPTTDSELELQTESRRVDEENQEKGYYTSLIPASFFREFHLLIRNDDKGFFGGKRRTRRSKKSKKNKRKNKRTNKRSRC